MKYSIYTLLAVTALLSIGCSDQAHAEGRTQWVCYYDKGSRVGCISEPRHICNEWGCKSIEEKLKDPTFYRERVTSLRHWDEAGNRFAWNLLYGCLIILGIMTASMIFSEVMRVRGENGK